MLFKDNIVRLRKGEDIENLPLIDPDVSLDDVSTFITCYGGLATTLATTHTKLDGTTLDQG